MSQYVKIPIQTVIMSTTLNERGSITLELEHLLTAFVLNAYTNIDEEILYFVSIFYSIVFENDHNDHI